MKVEKLRGLEVWRFANYCILCLLLLFSSCGEHYTPKPRGYYRIAIPDTAYQTLSLQGYPYDFAVSTHATVIPHAEAGEKYWLDILYPAFDVRVHCSYKPVKNQLRMLSDDAQDFVYKHAGKATAIPEQGYYNDSLHVYGVFYELRGNTASPYQFYLTDSTQHFFRAAVYFNCTPNQDSLAPIIDYLQVDMRHLIETFQWNATPHR